MCENVNEIEKLKEEINGLKELLYHKIEIVKLKEQINGLTTRLHDSIDNRCLVDGFCLKCGKWGIANDVQFLKCADFYFCKGFVCEGCSFKTGKHFGSEWFCCRDDCYDITILETKND